MKGSIQKDRKTRSSIQEQDQTEIKLSMKQNFTPNRGQMPNLIPQNLLVLKTVIKDSRTMLQPNTLNSSIKWTAHCPKDLVFFLFPKPRKSVNKN